MTSENNMTEEQILELIRGEIKKATAFSTKKIGDTPTDDIQLVPKKYVTSVVAGIPGGTPGGANGQVQFNDAGSFGGDSGFTYDKATATVTASIVSAQVLVDTPQVQPQGNGETLFVIGGNGTVAGGDARIFGGNAGSGAAGNVLLRGGQTLSSVTGAVIVGESPLTTTTNDGHFYIPYCVGVPTGTPTFGTGAMIWDASNAKLYVFTFGSPGSWTAIN